MMKIRFNYILNIIFCAVKQVGMIDIHHDNKINHESPCILLYAMNDIL